MATLATTYENEGYDGTRNGLRWWFEAWGSGPKANWTRRDEIGRPPRPSELRSADYIVIALRHRNGRIQYLTRTGGLDLDPRVARRKESEIAEARGRDMGEYLKQLSALNKKSRKR